MFSNTQAAKFAALVMYGWDMCDNDLYCLSPAPDPRITAEGWYVMGYITGNDNIIKSGKSIRRKILDVSSDCDSRVCYGYLANNSAGDYVAVIRGTDGAEEWFDDFDFILCEPKAPLKGKVDGGFYGIYKTLQLSTNTNGDKQLAAGIVQTIAGANITVLGHSLGAALATYLTAELVALLPPSQVTACLFASPKTGNKDFVYYIQSNVKNYQVFNYKKDLVPLTPPLGYSALPNCTILSECQFDLTISPTPACCHHLICYIALLDADFYLQLVEMPDMTADDKNCAACITTKYT
jgi:triacylglycerol lipase